MNRKGELQSEIIKNFEEEKIKLLNTIETLEFEKGCDKEMNHNAFDTAKALIQTMEKQIHELSTATNDINRLKEQYKRCLEQAEKLKNNYQIAIDAIVSEIRTDLSMDNKQDKKRKIALLNRLKGRK